MMHEVSKVLRLSGTEAHPGILGRNKIKGTVYVNKTRRIVIFVNESDSKCRTFIKASGRQLESLEKRKYHLFPKA